MKMKLIFASTSVQIHIWKFKFQIRIAHFSNFRGMKLEVWRTQLIHILQVYVLHIFFFETYSIIFPPNNKLWALFCVLRAHLICTCFGRWLRLRPRRHDLTENLWQVNNLRVISSSNVPKLESSNHQWVVIFWVQKFEPYYLLCQLNYTKNLTYFSFELFTSLKVDFHQDLKTEALHLVAASMEHFLAVRALES